MTPETRLAYLAIGLTLLGIGLTLAAVVAAGLEHKGERT